MGYWTYNGSDTGYPIAILTNYIQTSEMKKEYIDPYVNSNDVIIFSLYQNPEKKKTPVSEIKGYLSEELIEYLKDQRVQYVVCTDSEYFKVLTGTKKAEANLGYIMDSPYGDFKVIYCPSHKAIFYDPDKVREKIRIGMTALKNHMEGQYSKPGDNIIRFAEYPSTISEIRSWLNKLKQHPALTVDIEGFSLKAIECGIGSISFAWNEHEGIAFQVDKVKGSRNTFVRLLLRKFFEEYTGIIIFHNIAFDVNVLIYQLFMDDITDTAGLLNGLSVMLKNWHCTRLISYLALNSCAGNKLGLKDLSQEFAGNYAVDNIKDISAIPLDKLLEYNLIDTLSTWHVLNKYHPKMVQDNQFGIYENLFKPATVDIIQMQLTGLPLDMERVKEVQIELQAEEDKAVKSIMDLKLVNEFIYMEREAEVIERNNKYKVKRITIEDAKFTLNINSGDQLQKLLYEFLALPVLDYTDTNQPATGGKTLEKLLHTPKAKEREDITSLLNALIDFKAVNKINTSFIPAFLEAPQGKDGWHYLLGNFVLGGTVSGRLSSNSPNLQNLPATGSKYAKIIKSCFKAPPGWILVGLDFSSLEDRISALTTKDPNKLKVYTDGFDGHCLRAYAYFGDQMTGIDPNSVESINSIAKLYKSLRQESKVPTFALTYAGTFKTLMNNLGFSEEKAKTIEKRYHELYVVSDKWVSDKLDQATKDGFVTVAFGLRVRTPLLKQVIRGTRKTPYEAEAEGRTAGNALGQSWCLLNSRAWVEFMRLVRNSQYRLDIRPCAQIHDAGYALVRNDIGALEYMNKHLVDAVNWQDDPEISHPDVKLGGELSIFYPTWAKEIVIPNGANGNEIRQVFQEAIAA